MSVAVAVGIPVIVQGWVRFRGLAVQEALITQWKGMPTIRWLRLNDNSFGSRHAVWRDAMNRLSKKPFPDKLTEAADPVEADQTYDSAGAIARELTRDSKLHPRVLMENANYGLDGNLFGFKAIGVAISWFCVAADLAVVGLSAFGKLSFPPTC